MENKKKRKCSVYLIVDISTKYGRNLLSGISRYVQKTQNWEIETDFSFFGRKLYKELTFDNRKIDGIIVFNPDKKLFKKVIESGIPAIVKGIDHPVPGYTNFITDNFTLTKMAFDHFRQLGLNTFAYCGLDTLLWSRERREAFRYVIKPGHHKLYIYPMPKTKKNRYWEFEKLILSKWLISLPKPIGLLAANDFRAKQVLDACMEASIKVPEEIAVLGVDNDECIWPFTRPPLSSISRFFRKAGFEAASVLNELMIGNNNLIKEIIVEPREVIQRQSTNILAVDNTIVAEALMFIRSNKYTLLTVNDVANHLAVHPRILYNLFKIHLGYTIHDEIKRVRTDEIAHLLLETNLTVSQISRKMGFTNYDHVARYFRKNKNISPTEYRNRYKT